MTMPALDFRQFERENIRRSQDLLGSSGTLGGQAENEFFQRSLGFDAQQGAVESARGIVGSLTPDLQRNLEFARGQAVGRGRLDTGFFDEDRGRLFEDFNTRVANAVAANALQAQRLNLANVGQIGQFGENIQNRFVNLLGGSLDRATAERNAEPPSLFGRLLGAGLSIAGTAVGGSIGGPQGAAVGGAVGREAGGIITPTRGPVEINPGGGFG
jgi:hypothetical protein